jgi:tetratricopeptide (TPR) repeat protein
MARKSRITTSTGRPAAAFPHAICYPGVAIFCLALGAGIGFKIAPSKSSVVAAQPVNTQQESLDRTVGNAAFDQKDWPAAIEAYTAAIAAGAADPDVYTDLGTAYRFNNQPLLALQEYQAAQAKWPTHENSLFNQGGVYAFSLNEPDQAINAWQSYLLKFPNGSHAADAEQLIANVKAHMAPASKPG